VGAVTDDRWELFPKGSPATRVPLDLPGDAEERRRGNRKAITVFVLIVLCFTALAALDASLATGIALIAAGIFIIHYRRTGGGRRYRSQLTEWAHERGLEDLGGSIWGWDGSTDIPEEQVIAATAGAREVNAAMRSDSAAQVQGTMWRAAGPVTITAGPRRSAGRGSSSSVTVITVPLDFADVPETPRDVLGVDGLAIHDRQLELWVLGNLLRDVAMERYARANDTPLGVYAGANDRLLALVAKARDVHRVMAGD
jgi:hypothetical protein